MARALPLAVPRHGSFAPTRASQVALRKICDPLADTSVQQPHTCWQIGELVRLRGDTWRIADVRRHRNCEALRLAGAGAANRGVDRTLLEPFDRPTRLASRTAPRSVSSRRLLAVVSAAAATSVPWDGIGAAASADIIIYPYQLEPAIALLRGLATRILLADDVGLGKTVQAGLALGELLRRGDTARALVLTPAGLRGQWAEELARRFAIDATIADAAWLRQAAAALPRGRNPWSLVRVAIVSHDFIKRPTVLQALESLTWDLVIVDEAHAVAGASDRHRAAEGLARRARRVLLVTATPHGGDDRAFRALCDLGRLGGDGDGAVLFRRTRAHVGLDARRRVRTLRVRPTDAERRLHRLLERYTASVWREAGARGDRGDRGDNDARLAMIVLRKRALSSAASLSASIDRRLASLGEHRADDAAQMPLPFDPDGDTDRGDEEPLDAIAAPGLADRAREQEWLRELAAAARAAAVCESKVAALQRLLRRTRESVVVFTEYRDTLVRLAPVLAHGNRVAILHGGLPPDERAAAVRALNRGDARILLATDTGGEGLNLQTRCRWVVNFELPWSPARLEQRIGRVDRLGQTRVPHATHLVARDTAESLVLVRLLGRLARARAALGDRAGPAAVLPEAAVAALVMTGARRVEPLAATTASGPAPAGWRPAPRLGRIAAREAERLAATRRLAALARGDPRAPHAPAGDEDGPVVGRLRARGRRRLWHAARLPRGVVYVFRAAILDVDGRTVDADLLSLFLPQPRLPGGGQRPRTIVEALLAPVQGTAMRTLRCALRRRLHLVAGPHASAAARLADREARLLAEARVPLARLVVQPGLFDRRAMRDAANARARSIDRVEDLEAHLAACRAAAALAAGAPELVAAVILA